MSALHETWVHTVVSVWGTGSSWSHKAGQLRDVKTNDTVSLTQVMRRNEMHVVLWWPGPGIQVTSEIHSLTQQKLPVHAEIAMSLTALLSCRPAATTWLTWATSPSRLRPSSLRGPWKAARLPRYAGKLFVALTTSLKLMSKSVVSKWAAGYSDMQGLNAGQACMLIVLRWLQCYGAWLPALIPTMLSASISDSARAENL